MKNYYLASLCLNGILGGALRFHEDSLVFHTNKLTVNEKYRNYAMPYREIETYAIGNLLLFPTVTIVMSNTEKIKFIVFGRNRFLKQLNELIGD